MKTIRLTATDDALLTAHELLEDFADSSPGWQFLDDVSKLYTKARGVDSCVLRSWNVDVPGSVDIAFTGRTPSSVELTIVAKDEPVSLESRSSVVDTFAEEFGSYLEGKPRHIEMEELQAKTA